MDYESRRDRLRKMISKQRATAMLVTCPTNVTYLTGFTGDSSYLWIDDQSQRLVSDGRFTQQLSEECSDLDVIIRKPNVSILTATMKALRAAKLQSLLVEGDTLSKNGFDKLSTELKSAQVKSSSGLVETLREIKDRDEVFRIQRAVEIAEKAFLELREYLAQSVNSGEKTEKQVADALESFLRKNGALCSSFRTIVGVGPRASLPHGMPSEKRLCESPMVLIDWGAREGQYVSDLTRVLVTGTLPSKIDRIYHTVVEAQASAIRAIQPGAMMSQVDAVARTVIEQAGFGKRFTHSLGHGFGLQVHESVRLAKGQDRPLKVGMVVTVEPGIYLPNVGGVRIEDNILVTRGGCRLLSSLPRDLESNRVRLT